MIDPEPVLLDITLRPHRSLSPRGQSGLTVLLVGLAGGLSAGFWWLGAWPVVGLMGADIALLVWALHWNQRKARRCEKIHLTPSRLLIRRIDERGSVQDEQLQPTWLRIELKHLADHSTGPLRLTSHGRSITIGAFLSPAERITLAETLQQGLAQLRQPYSPNTSRIE